MNTMTMKAAVLAAGLAITIGGCAKRADEVEAIQVSTVGFDTYSCKQIETEARRVAKRSGELAGRQDEQATTDAAITAAAVVLFLPAAFFIGGNDENTAELARLKGELEALEAVSEAKKCGLVFRVDEATEAPADAT